MLAKLIVEGREFPIEIQDPELQKLLTLKKKTGYERVKTNEQFYYALPSGFIENTAEEYANIDDVLYEACNYYSDRTVAENNARADKLMRQLRRFAVEHRERSLDWNVGHSKYYIDYNHGKSLFEIFAHEIYQSLGAIYFDSHKTANLAIETFHDELIWYFTEYKDSL